jgi:hypothetical protein
MTDTMHEGTDAGLDTGELYVDYWGTDEIHRHLLPDGKQWFEFKIMDEGARTRFQKLTNNDLTVMRDNTAKVKMDPAQERHTLIKESVVNWNLFAKDASGHQGPVLFNKHMLEKWLEKAPPKIVDELEFAIRKANPWMQADMSVEEIDKEIQRLYDLRKDVLARESGEDTSGSK